MDSSDRGWNDEVNNVIFTLEACSADRVHYFSHGWGKSQPLWLGPQAAL